MPEGPGSSCSRDSRPAEPSRASRNSPASAETRTGRQVESRSGAAPRRTRVDRRCQQLWDGASPDVPHPGAGIAALENGDAVHVWIPFEQRRPMRFNQPREMRAREAVLERSHRGQRVNDVSHGGETNDQQTHEPGIGNRESEIESFISFFASCFPSYEFSRSGRSWRGPSGLRRWRSFLRRRRPHPVPARRLLCSRSLLRGRRASTAREARPANPHRRERPRRRSRGRRRSPHVPLPAESGGA